MPFLFKTKLRRLNYSLNQVMTENANISISVFWEFCKRNHENVAMVTKHLKSTEFYKPNSSKGKDYSQTLMWKCTLDNF